eukprot:475149_1
MFKFTTMHICIFTWLSFLIFQGTYTQLYDASSAHLYFEVVDNNTYYTLRIANSTTMQQLQEEYREKLIITANHADYAVQLINADSLFTSIGIEKQFSSINEAILAVKNKIIEHPSTFLVGYHNLPDKPISSKTVVLTPYPMCIKCQSFIVYKVSVPYYYSEAALADEDEIEDEDDRRRRLGSNASDAVYNNFYLLAVFVIVLFIVTALYLLV